MTGKKNLKKRFSRFSLSGLLSPGSSSSDIPRAYEQPSPNSTSPSLGSPPRRSPPSPPPLAPGDKPTYTLGHKVSPAEVRELHELIRRRCELDNSIWSNRKCFPEVREEVKKEMDRSDAVLARIKALVQSWDTEDAWDGNTANWRKLQEIRRKLEEPGKQNWAAHPPWEETQEDEDTNFEEPDSHLPLHTYRQPPPPRVTRTVSPYTAPAPPVPQTYTPMDEYPVPAPTSPVVAPVNMPYRPRNEQNTQLYQAAQRKYIPYSQRPPPPTPHELPYPLD